MDNAHKNIIISNLRVLVDETNIKILGPELVKREVFNEEMINRIMDPSRNEKEQKTDLYVEILRRGPNAFENLQKALASTNHQNLVEILESSSTLPNFNWNGNESDGPCLSTQRRNSVSSLMDDSPNLIAQPQEYPNIEPSRSSDIMDFRSLNVSDPKSKVFNYPVYTTQDIKDYLIRNGLYTAELLQKTVNYMLERELPVQVRYSTDWKTETPGFPRLYKMDSMPRGLALVVNNKSFWDKKEYPDRFGAENDESRFIQLLKQLHFEVESHENKKRQEMRSIIDKFTQRKELEMVDCVWVTFMSHGEEGDTHEDSKVVGIDGLGLETDEIIRRFDNASCPPLINKPKIFFFQACRGGLTDPGVEAGNFNLFNLNGRIATDGKKVTMKVRERTQSDIFAAYPAPLGFRANRDLLTGAWFIQEVVDVFSKHACTTPLDDLIKMVDQEIKKLNTLSPPNFQAVSTKTIGWNRHLYFNPGLCRDPITGATIRIKTPSEAPQPDEGMDVVDMPEKNPHGTRVKDDKDEDSDDQSGINRLLSSCCKPS